MKKGLLSLALILGSAAMAWAGDGTEASPYTVDEVLSMSADAKVTGVYVQGYIVGTIPSDGRTLSSTVFSAQNASDTNVVLGSFSSEDDASYCIAVQLPKGDIRTALSVMQNPDNIGHQVLIKGDIEKYFDRLGIKQTSSYKWIGDAPTPGGGGSGSSADYLTSGIDGFTIESATDVPQGLDYVWTWSTQYNCAVATGYNSATKERFAVDSYLVSPEIALGDNTTATIEQALSYLYEGVMSENIGIYVREANGAWNEVSYNNPPSGSSFTFVTSQIDLSAYKGKTIQIGFRYRSTTEIATTWEIKNLKIGGTAQGGGTVTPTEVMTVAEALAWLEDGNKGNATVQGYITSIEEISTQYGNATYNIADSATGSTTLKVYRGYYLNGDKFTSEDQIKVGDLVVVEGNLELYGNYKEPELTTGSKIISINGEGGNTGGGNDNPGGGNDKPGTTPEGPSVTFDFTAPSTLGAGFSDAGENGSVVLLNGMTLTNAPASISFACPDNTQESSQPRLYYGSGNAAGWTMRFYKDSEVTIAVSSDYLLTGIEFNGTNLTSNIVYSNGSLSGSTWTPSAPVSSMTVTKTATGNNPTIKTITVYYVEAAGVDGIEAEEGEAVYFNLQGVRVANPEHGIFVKVVGGKATKVIM